MPRRARLVPPGVPLHLIQRGNNRQVCFLAEDDCRFYLDWLTHYARKLDVAIHAWVLMTNHVHLLVSPADPAGPGAVMQALGQRYVQHFNRAWARSGTLWEGRFRSCPVDAEAYLLACQRYIELNPVRAGMVGHPAEYRWSSFRANALGELAAADDLVVGEGAGLNDDLQRGAADHGGSHQGDVAFHRRPISRLHCTEVDDHVDLGRSMLQRQRSLACLCFRPVRAGREAAHGGHPDAIVQRTGR